MPSGVVYSRRAAAEVEEITASLAEYSRAAAARLLQALERAEQQLSQFPDSGAPDLLPGTRRLIVGSYVVSYRRRGGNSQTCSSQRCPRAGCNVTLLSPRPRQGLASPSATGWGVFQLVLPSELSA